MCFVNTNSYCWCHKGCRSECLPNYSSTEIFTTLQLYNLGDLHRKEKISKWAEVVWCQG